MCLGCFKFLFLRTRRGAALRKHGVRPRSVNCSTYLSSAQLPHSSNTEVTVLMNQVQKSRKNSFRSQPSVAEDRQRRFSDGSEEFFLRSMEKRQKKDIISRDCLELYKEVSGVLILDHQLRQQVRRTPPVGIKTEERQHTW